MSPIVWTGVTRFNVVPSPSWPSRLYPQAQGAEGVAAGAPAAVDAVGKERKRAIDRAETRSRNRAIIIPSRSPRPNVKASERYRRDIGTRGSSLTLVSGPPLEGGPALPLPCTPFPAVRAGPLSPSASKLDGGGQGGT